jgi:hypothetical protein
MRLFRPLSLAAFSIGLLAAPCVAQTPAKEPPLRRWFEFQTFSLGARYRFVESNADRVTSNDLQYREQIRGRVNLDAHKRYTINFGTGSGNAFSSGWDYSGAGINDADYHNHYFKLLYASAIPVTGLELQYGGIPIARGEATEITSFDDDGYAMGARGTIRRPKSLYLDELTVTRAKMGPINSPNIHDRWKYLDDPDYTQVLLAKRFSPQVAASLDYATQASADTVRAAISYRLKPNPVLTSVRYEQYHRFNAHEASGFVITGERPVTKWVRLQAGVLSIDQFYGNWNADRIVRGKRVYATANFPIVGPLAGQFFVTRAFHADYPISNRTRVDAVINYDVLSTLRKTGRF